VVLLIVIVSFPYLLLHELLHEKYRRQCPIDRTKLMPSKQMLKVTCDVDRHTSYEMTLEIETETLPWRHESSAGHWHYQRQGDW